MKLHEEIDFSSQKVGLQQGVAIPYKLLGKKTTRNRKKKSDLS